MNHNVRRQYENVRVSMYVCESVCLCTSIHSFIVHSSAERRHQKLS